MSAFLLSKSSENTTAANKLFSLKLYASTVHCAYYSCVQLMSHILRSDFGTSETEIERESNNISSHEWLQTTIATQLLGRNFMLLSDFNTYTVQLKRLRVRADYKNLVIEEKHAKDAIQWACIIHQILNANFRL
jgi:uncharacterized protein (UPF0332 family)